MKKYIIFITLLIGIYILWFNKNILIKKIPPIAPKDTIGIQNISPLYIPNKYNQNDLQWNHELLGATNETLGNVGCLVSSVAMNLSYYNIKLTPKELNLKLKKIDGYTNSGWLIWKQLTKLETNIALKIEFPPLSYKSIDDFLLKNIPVLAKVLIHEQIPHWVLIVGKRNGEYLILDPLYSQKLTPISKYHSLIYSIRVIKEKE